MVVGLLSSGFGGAAFAQSSAVPLPAYQGMTFDSRGKTIRCIRYWPAGDGRNAGVVMMHGSGARITDRGPWHGLAMRLAADGYHVLTPLFTDAYPDDGVRPQRMMQAWRDVGRDAIDWLIEQGLPQQRTGMFGYSLGSYVAVDGALGNSRASAAIGLAGGVDVYPPRVPRRRVPVLMIRAENDTHVLPQNTAAWIRFLDDHEVSVRERVIAGAGHIFTPAQWLEVFEISAAFFAGNIGRPDGRA